MSIIAALIVGSDILLQQNLNDEALASWETLFMNCEKQAMYWDFEPKANIAALMGLAEITHRYGNTIHTSLYSQKALTELQALIRDTQNVIEKGYKDRCWGRPMDGLYWLVKNNRWLFNGILNDDNFKPRAIADRGKKQIQAMQEQLLQVEEFAQQLENEIKESWQNASVEAGQLLLTSAMQTFKEILISNIEAPALDDAPTPEVTKPNRMMDGQRARFRAQYYQQSVASKGLRNQRQIVVRNKNHSALSLEDVNHQNASIRPQRMLRQNRYRFLSSKQPRRQITRNDSESALTNIMEI